METSPKDGSVTYSVPITSSLQFSLLYDPNDNIAEAKKGFKFETAGEVLSMKTLPKVSVCCSSAQTHACRTVLAHTHTHTHTHTHIQLLRVTRSFQGNSPDNSVVENELLVVKGVKSKITGTGLSYTHTHTHTHRNTFKICNQSISIETSFSTLNSGTPL